MEDISIGSLRVGRQGFGAMGLTHSYGLADEAESLRTLDRAFELGIRLLDTADIYGVGKNEELVAKTLRGRRDQWILATKFGQRLDRSTSGRAIDGRPNYVRACIEASLKRLQTDHVDLYYLHRLDPQVPIEETVGELGRMREEGKKSLRSACQKWTPGRCAVRMTRPLLRRSRANIRSGPERSRTRSCP